MRGPWLTLFAAVALAVPAAPQAEEGVERLPLRVAEVPPTGLVVVDRGTRDGVAEGDRVFFHPRTGGVVPGLVVAPGERTSDVELLASGVELELGTRGEVLVPRARLDALRAEREVDAPAAPDVPEHPPWATDEWTPDMPLLAEIPAVHPEERGRQLSGRAYFVFDGVGATEDDRTDLFARLGLDTRVENPFGRGGELHVDAELNARRTDVEGQVDLDEGGSRIDRASYLRGGTRYDVERWEVGRFLIHGMPEFGVTDGVEYARRLGNGDTVGASAGYMPSPDQDMESGDDFQLSAYYRWTADEREQLTAALGLQKTFHQARTDRDLLVAKVQYLPLGGWDLYGSVWVDFYEPRDVVKLTGPEVTQAIVSAGRRWETGNGVNVTYTRLRFPELQRVEFLPPADLLNARNDRVALTGWRQLSGSTRVRGLVGVWDDENDDGGDAEVALEFDDWFRDGSRTALALLATQGEFATVVGARLTHDRPTENGRWDLLYEASNQDQDGFSADNDDILTHWLRVGRDFHTFSGWDFSVHADARAWDDEASFGLGIYLQRRF